MDLATAAGCLLVGLAAGVLSGMFGVGGAVITTPGIRAMGATPIEAVGSTIPAILPAAISGAHRYAKAGLVDWRVALTCGISGTLLAIGGAKVSDVVDARWLMVATAGLLMWSGVSSIRKGLAHPAPDDDPVVVEDPVAVDDPGGPAEVSDRLQLAASSTVRGPTVEGSSDRSGLPASPTIRMPQEPVVPEQVPGVVVLAVVGALAGFVAGLLGVGGGIVMVPMFTGVLRLPVKVAVASSLVAVAIFSVPAMVSHAVLGHIDWAIALALVLGTVPGARIGSRIAIGTSDRRMRLLLGAFFCVIAVVYGGRELTGLL